MSDATDNELARVVRELKTSIDKLRDELVRKDVYTAQREADKDAVRELAKDVSDIQGTMRWQARVLVASLILPLLSSFILLYVSQQVIR